MSEATETKAPETAVTKGVPPEVSSEIDLMIKRVAKLDKASALQELQEKHNLTYNAEAVNEQWLKRKLKNVEQATILAAHGVAISPKVQSNMEKFDKTDPNSPPDKVGRKRMTTNGKFKFAIPEGGNEGRSNSCKGQLIAALKDKEFSYEDFKAVVSGALQWDEEQKSFNGHTRFKTLDQASGAWWSELKNKAKIIAEVPAA